MTEEPVIIRVAWVVVMPSHHDYVMIKDQGKATDYAQHWHGMIYPAYMEKDHYYAAWPNQREAK